MHTFYSAQDKILMHACLATFYFNVYFKCPLEVPCLGVFHSLSQLAEDPEWGKIDVTLEPNSGILDHLIKALSFLVCIQHVCFIQMLEQMGLSCIDHQLQLSWAWYMAQRDGHWNKRPFQLREYRISFRIATAWQRKPTYDPTSYFRKLQYIVPLHHQKIHAFSPSNLTKFTTHIRIYS